MKTQQELETLTKWIANVEIAHDGTEEDDYMFGVVLAYQDIANSEKPRQCDRFAVQRMRAVSPARALGYEHGRKVAMMVLSAMTPGKKCHPPKKGVDVMQNYGRVR